MKEQSQKQTKVTTQVLIKSAWIKHPEMMENVENGKENGESLCLSPMIAKLRRSLRNMKLRALHTKMPFQIFPHVLSPQ